MNGKILLVIVGLLVACVATAGIAGSLAAPQKTTGTIEMVQPCGWAWCANYDSQYAQGVNKPNSEANLNNGMAEEARARADAIRIDAYQADNLNEFKGGAAVGYMGACFTMLILLVIGGFVWKYAGGG